MVVKRVLRFMPEDSGIRIRVRKQPGDEGSIEHIITLMYADDVVLMAHDVGVLVDMLKVLDQVATQFGMKVNAAKTVVQVLGGPLPNQPDIHLTYGQVQVDDEFKYLGSWTQQDGGMDKEMTARRSAALGVFHSLEKVWCNKKLKVSHKMAVYNSCVLPHFTYACEAWHCTCAQLDVLEKAHRECLRRIIGVTLHDNHSNEHVLNVCKSHPLGLIITKRVFRWLGHVMRMPSERYPRMAYGCELDARKPAGRPKMSFRHMYAALLGKVGMSKNETRDWLSDMHERAQDRVGWRSLVDQFAFVSKPVGQPTRCSKRIAATRSRQAC